MLNVAKTPTTANNYFMLCVAFQSDFLLSLRDKKYDSTFDIKKNVYKNKNNQKIIAKKEIVCDVTTKNKCRISYIK